jgi:hypothetical protein
MVVEQLTTLVTQACVKSILCVQLCLDEVVRGMALGQATGTTVSSWIDQWDACTVMGGLEAVQTSGPLQHGTAGCVTLTANPAVSLLVVTVCRCSYVDDMIHSIILACLTSATG